MSERRWIGRAAVCAAVLISAMVGLGFRLAFLHLGPHEKERTGVRKSRSMEKKLLAGRGRIYDSRGGDNILAVNLSVEHVCADPRVVVESGEVRKTALVLSNLLALPIDRVAVQLNRPERRFEYIRRYTDRETCDTIRTNHLAGVSFRPATLRYYPHESFLCHVLGFVNHEGVGSSGVEQSMDRYLQGSAGVMELRVNAKRQELRDRRERYIPALQGADVYLTINQNVQYIVEKILAQVVEEHHAKAAWAIVQRVQTGEILAMAALPAYDLNQFRDAGDQDKLNRALGCVYEPGSTLKAAVYAAALNEGLVTPDTVFDCENGAWPHAGKILHDFHPYGMLNVADGVKKSSNIMAAKVSLLVGKKRYYDYLRAFGIGTCLGIDLPGEEAGILHNVSRWSEISCSRLAIGQGVAVTALQMLNVYSTIANDGLLMRPYVVRRVVSQAGTVLMDRQPEVIARPITAETAAIMQGLLLRVTEDRGTGRRARVEGYEVAGKTGTAQKAVGGVYSSNAYIASFVGFTPARDPEIAVIVVVDEPQPIHTGGVVAAPAFSRIVSETVRCLDIPPRPADLVANYQGAVRE